MISKSYGEFSRSIHQRFAGRREALEVSIEVTRRCPLGCLHCYNNLPMADRAARERELTTAEHFRLLDECSDLGCLWLLYTGGEIFARTDFLEIYTYAKQKGFLITLFTNGTLIHEKIADHLAEWPPFVVEITLYGRTRETYEAMTGVPGSHARCLRGIQLLRERGVPLKLKTVSTRINRHEVPAMRRFAEEELGVEFKFDSLVNPRIDCSQNPLAIRLQPEEVVALDFAWPNMVREYRVMAEREMAQPAAEEAEPGVYVCGGGMSSFAVNPYGQMSVCLLSQQETRDFRPEGVKAVWEGFLAKVREKKRTRPSKCVRCRLQSLCGMCPANGELENGDPETPVTFLCQVAHLRAWALGLEVPEHGACECCPGGEHHAALCASAERIRAGEVDVEGWAPPPPLLPVLNNSPVTAGGCGCGAHAHD